MKLLVSGDLNPNVSKIEKTTVKFFSHFDFVISNLEGPITSSNDKVIKAGAYVKQPEWIDKFIGLLRISHVNLANNHTMDYGMKGLSGTIAFLNKNKIIHFGAGKTPNTVYQAQIIKKDGVSVALLGLSEMEFGVVESDSKKGGVAWINDPLINSNIKKLKQENDYLIVFTHAGIEYVYFPLEEWKKRYRQLIDLGADLVIGLHPHVMQGDEKYKNGRIFYSLGNFIFKEHQDPGLLLSITLGEKKIKIKKYFIYKNKIVDNLQIYKKIIRLLSVDKDNIVYQNLIRRKWWQVYFPLIIKSSLVLLLYQLPLLKKDKLYTKALAYLSHNFKIESHRYLIQDYLDNLVNRN